MNQPVKRELKKHFVELVYNVVRELRQIALHALEVVVHVDVLSNGVHYDLAAAVELDSVVQRGQRFFQLSALLFDAAKV